MRGENGKESGMVCGLSCLQICIGKQNVKIIDKKVEIKKSKNELFQISWILIYLCRF